MSLFIPLFLDMRAIFNILHFCAITFGINTKVIANLVYRIFMASYYDHTLVINIITNYFS